MSKSDNVETAWCMSDAEVIGSEKTDAFCEQVINAAIKPYQQ